jgi:hypothetical protein
MDRSLIDPPLPLPFQGAGVSKNIDAVLNGKPAGKVKMLPFDVFICATGRDRTVGRMGGVKILSIMGWYGKGKTLALGTFTTPDVFFSHARPKLEEGMCFADMDDSCRVAANLH